MKTIAQKLASATKKLKQEAKLNNALNYRMNGLRSELETSKAMLKTSQLYLAYLAARLCGHDEVPEEFYELEIGMEELMNFKLGYDTASQMDIENKVITLRIFKNTPEAEASAMENASRIALVASEDEVEENGTE